MQLTLEEPDTSAEKLTKEWKKSRKKVLPPNGFMSADTYTTETTQRKRSPEVKAWVLLEANRVSESCGTEAPFMKNGGIPYLEVHHVIQLAHDGPDKTNNAVAICSNCHRALHLAENKDVLIESLYSRINRLA